MLAAKNVTLRRIEKSSAVPFKTTLNSEDGIEEIEKIRVTVVPANVVSARQEADSIGKILRTWMLHVSSCAQSMQNIEYKRFTRKILKMKALGS